MLSKFVFDLPYVSTALSEKLSDVIEIYLTYKLENSLNDRIYQLLKFDCTESEMTEEEFDIFIKKLDTYLTELGFYEDTSEVESVDFINCELVRNHVLLEIGWYGQSSQY